MKTRILLIAILLASVLPVCAETLRIGRITVHALDVYSQEEATRGSVYRLADRLHRETRQEVVRQFLLFHEGDVYLPALLEETERNLRALSFLKSADVVASPPHDRVVDVTVTTQDAWSIAPETKAGSMGGANTFGADIEDTNLLGYGKQVLIGWNRGIDRSSLGVTYNDPAFFAPYWRAHVGIAGTSDGYDRRVSIGRPFYSFSTPWATAFSVASIRQNDHLYRDGFEVSRFAQNHRQVLASFGFAQNPTETQAHRFSAGIRFVDDQFSAIAARTTTLPESHQFRYVFFRYDSARNRFMKMNFVNKDLRYEDFDLGRQYSTEVAVSPAFFGAATTTEFVRIAAANGTPLAQDGFFLAEASASTRIESGFRNMIANVSVNYVHRNLGEHPRALVARAIVSSAWRPDLNVQFFADGVSGLRGFPVHSFAGTRAYVLNVEERLYLGRELLQLASPGIVAFVDAGDAANTGFVLKSDAGIGIRVGLPRTPRNLMRLDLAFPLQNDPLGRRRPMISFSSGQAF